MGYRNYFYSLPVEEYEKIKNLNADNSIKQIISKVFLDF